MKDPIELSPRRARFFVCINIVTGHIRNRKWMSTEQAIRINSLKHMTATDYKWLWDDQCDFNDKPVDKTNLGMGE